MRGAAISAQPRRRSRLQLTLWRQRRFLRGAGQVPAPTGTSVGAVCGGVQPRPRSSLEYSSRASCPAAVIWGFAGFPRNQPMRRALSGVAGRPFPPPRARPVCQGVVGPRGRLRPRLFQQRHGISAAELLLSRRVFRLDIPADRTKHNTGKTTQERRDELGSS